MRTDILRDTRSPRYFKIIQHYVKEIEENRLKNGDLIPSEAEIDKMFNVSRTTTRRALDELAQKGYIVKTQGKKSYIQRQNYIDQYPVLSSYYEDLRASARLPEHKTLSHSIQKPFAQICKELEIKVSDDCLHLKRLLSIDSHPVGYAEIWIPVSLIEDHVDLFIPEIIDPHSIYRTLEGKEIGLNIARAIEVATAENCDEKLGQLLNVETGTALLIIRHIGYLDNGKPCDSLKLAFGGTHYHYRTELVRPPGSGWSGRVFIVDD